jgi:hypothetical protein
MTRASPRCGRCWSGIWTGTTAAFAPARMLYRSAGFVPCGPFGGYQPSADNTFMTLELGASAGSQEGAVK